MIAMPLSQQEPTTTTGPRRGAKDAGRGAEDAEINGTGDDGVLALGRAFEGDHLHLGAGGHEALVEMRGDGVDELEGAHLHRGALGAGDEGCGHEAGADPGQRGCGDASAWKGSSWGWSGHKKVPGRDWLPDLPGGHVRFEMKDWVSASVRWKTLVSRKLALG
jgi:hypothetical protein